MWKFLAPSVLIAAAAGAAWMTQAPPTPACGPVFPNQLLLRPDDALLSAPTAAFANELARIGPRPVAALRVVPADDPRATTLERDLDDLEASLEAAGVAPSERNGLMARLRVFREGLAAGRAVELPAALPAEFAGYLEGAAAWTHGDVAAARMAWERVLALPQEARRVRSTWAAYMLGRAAAATGNHEEAARRYQEVRRLAVAGFVDSLGLAATSLGWEAWSERERGRWVPALRLYLEQQTHGEPGAAESLERIARAVLAAGEPITRAVAADPEAQRVVTAYLLSRSASDLGDVRDRPSPEVAGWLTTLEGLGAGDVPGADRLAWLSYRYGRFDLAKRWVARADKASAITVWIRARLALRSGDVRGAAKQLRSVIAGFPEAEEWSYWPPDYDGLGVESEALRPKAKAQAELGLLELGRRAYVEALDLLVRSGYWLDAAYVAERVVTLAELRRYVDARWPAPRHGEGAEDTPDDARARSLRALLGRRLAREGRPGDAARYLPRPLAELVTDYAQALALGGRKGARAGDRAVALWRAAQLARHHGIELLGTELDPDWAWAEGQYELDPIATERAGHAAEWRFPPTRDELSRAARHAPRPGRRYHYRYVAAELAWQAAALLPDGDPEVARILCTAGHWLMNRDPQAADRFYKALVKRGKGTALGAAADARGWFSDDCQARP